MSNNKKIVEDQFKKVHGMAVSLSKLACDEIGEHGDEDLLDRFESTFYAYLMGVYSMSVTMPSAREMGENDA